MSYDIFYFIFDFMDDIYAVSGCAFFRFSKYPSIAAALSRIAFFVGWT